MKFYITAIGKGKFRNELPVELQQGFHMVGVTAHDGRWLITHADVADISVINENVGRFALSSETGNFSINGGGWNEWVRSSKGDFPVAWLAWNDGHPSNIFFMPRDFPSDPDFFRFEESKLGIWDITTAQCVLVGTCERETTMERIIDEVM